MFAATWGARSAASEGAATWGNTVTRGWAQNGWSGGRGSASNTSSTASERRPSSSASNRSGFHDVCSAPDVDEARPAGHEVEGGTVEDVPSPCGEREQVHEDLRAPQHLPEPLSSRDHRNGFVAGRPCPGDYVETDLGEAGGDGTPQLAVAEQPHAPAPSELGAQRLPPASLLSTAVSRGLPVQHEHSHRHEFRHELGQLGRHHARHGHVGIGAHQAVGSRPGALHEPEARKRAEYRAGRIADDEDLHFAHPRRGVGHSTFRKQPGELGDPLAVEVGYDDPDDSTHTGGSPGTGTGPTSSPSTSLRGIPNMNSRASR